MERKLHQGALNGYQADLPSILSMESLLFRMIGIAFLLLTLTLLSGLFFSEQIFGKAFVLDHKTVFAFASWAIFAALLLGRYSYGWRGRIALRWTLAGFLLLLGLAWFLETRSAPAHSQHWQFYVSVLCMYAVFAFPGFVYCFLWRRPGL